MYASKIISKFPQKCYWLEEGIEKDFIRMDRVEFRELFPIVKKVDDVKNAPPLVLLSVSGILKAVSRSSKKLTRQRKAENMFY